MEAAEHLAPPPDARPPVFGRPWMWLAFALVLVAVPLVGYMVRAGLAWEQMHPAINAILNGSSTVFLIAGFFAIRARRIEFHRACMLSAFTTSGVFLASYLARFAMSGVHRYPGSGVDKTIYLLILGSHTLLAMAALPLVITTLVFGLRDRRARHRRIARWTLPIWLYVSLTGVCVYVLLYHVGPALNPTP
jgi:putative membrane protein